MEVVRENLRTEVAADSPETITVTARGFGNRLAEGRLQHSTVSLRQAF